MTETRAGKHTTIPKNGRDREVQRERERKERGESRSSRQSL